MRRRVSYRATGSEPSGSGSASEVPDRLRSLLSGVYRSRRIHSRESSRHGPTRIRRGPENGRRVPHPSGDGDNDDEPPTTTHLSARWSAREMPSETGKFG